MSTGWAAWLAVAHPHPQPPCLSSLWLGPSLIRDLLGLPISCQGHLLQALRNLWTAQLVSGQRVCVVLCQPPLMLPGHSSGRG